MVLDGDELEFVYFKMSFVFELVVSMVLVTIEMTFLKKTQVVENSMFMLSDVPDSFSMPSIYIST